jgi:hypothetical protein
VLVAVTVAAVARTPQPGRADNAEDPPELQPHRVGARAHFLLILVPFAPWVFGSAALALAYLPALVAGRVAAHALLFSAVATTLTAVTGILVQPLVRRVHKPGEARILLSAMGMVLIGIGCAVWAAHELSPALVLLACALLGVAYGTAQFCGLVEVQRIARPGSLGTATASYQVLSYIGFAVPFILSAVQSQMHRSPPDLLLVLLGIAALATAWLALVTRRTHGRTA